MRLLSISPSFGDSPGQVSGEGLHCIDVSGIISDFTAKLSATAHHAMR